MSTTANQSRFEAGLPAMSTETRGQSIKARREALGIFTHREFERATERVGVKVPRASIANAEAGEASERIVATLEAALDRLEEETGQNDPDPKHVTFRISGNFGVDVTVEGPVADIGRLEESVAKLLREMKD
jgi:hypothetical protein